MSLASLEELYVHQLKDLYSAEKQLIKALPKMAKAASSPDLQEAFQMHLEQTKRQAERVEEICREMGKRPSGTTCKGMEGLIEEGKEVLEEDGAASVIDAALIAAAQRVEHYEMAGYGCARTYAEQLGYDSAAATLQEILDEESETNERLTQLAEGFINARAEDANG